MEINYQYCISTWKVWYKIGKKRNNKVLEYLTMAPGPLPKILYGLNLNEEMHNTYDEW